MVRAAIHTPSRTITTLPMEDDLQHNSKTAVIMLMKSDKAAMVRITP